MIFTQGKIDLSTKLIDIEKVSFQFVLVIEKVSKRARIRLLKERKKSTFESKDDPS